ncbi:MAG: hypothetical protein ACTHM1_08870 [Solirubrobacteraceae bacterium]
MRGILRHHPNDGRRRSGAGTRLFHRRTSGQAAPAPAPGAREQTPPSTDGLTPYLDFAARRVRAAGGPSDEASYTCACGCVFCAPVSATVACPHCGGEQDW